MKLTSVKTSFDAWAKFGMLIPKKLSSLLGKYSESAFDEAMVFILENRKSFEAAQISVLIGEVGKLTKGTHMLDAKWELSLAVRDLSWCRAVDGRTPTANHITNCLVYLLLDLADGSSEEDFLINLRKLK